MNLTLQTIPSTLISELFSNSKFDGVVLDTEHGNFNNETLYSCIQVITLYKKQCFAKDKKIRQKNAAKGKFQQHSGNKYNGRPWGCSQSGL